MNHFFSAYEPEEGKAFIYRSSAGSGKTFTLTKAYLKLVLRDPSRYHEILAITFTNKAKDEMKTRIVQELTKLARDENTDMRQQILLDFEAEGVERIKDVITPRANLVLDHLLHDYSRFNVSTIDHFFTRLIRHLAKELDLKLGYELDVDSKKALTEAIELLFQNADKDLLKWLNDFALTQINNEKGWNIRKNIADLGRKLFQESFMDIESGLSGNTAGLNQFIKEQKQTVEQFKAGISTQAQQAVKIAERYGLEQADFKAGIPYRNLVNFSERNADFDEIPSKTFMSALAPDLWHKKDAPKSEVISKAFHEGMGDCHAAIVNTYEGKPYQRYIEAKAVLDYIHSYGVLAALAHSLREYRSANNLIFISDSPFILNKVINESETPFIYEKIGAKYRYILIDEFQDTSFYQWKSLLPFFKNAIADGGQLIIVGDVKQSIYGWRGGDLSLLLKKVEQDILVPKANIRKLTTNYRSARNIIGFNNNFFTVAASLVPEIQQIGQFTNDFSLAYADVKQETFRDTDGFVEIKFLDKQEDSSWKDLAMQETATAINDALTDGYRLNDILLLTRKTAESRDIANYLLAAGIPALSETALRITSSAKVQLIISALKYRVNPNNGLARAEFNAFAIEVLKAENRGYNDESALLQRVLTLPPAPVYETIEELILLLNIEQSVDIYVQKLLDLALAQSIRGNSNPADFLNWWLEQEDTQSEEFSITTPENDDAVLVLTIHKAKGLEKPIVIIPFADFEMKPKTDIFWAKPLPEGMQTWGSLPVRFKDNLSETGFKEAYYQHYFDAALEALNLLYVAFTRPKIRLQAFLPVASRDIDSGALILKVLQHPEFTLQGFFDETANHFSYGSKVSSLADAAVLRPTDLLQTPSRPLPDELIVDRKKSQLFLSLHSEKSDKIREGIILHKILAVLPSMLAIDTVLEELITERLFSRHEAPTIKEKLQALFEQIPQLHEWFSGKYEVINERKIFSGNEVHIPDRVMVDGKAAIVVDYKREKMRDQHQSQIRGYANLLEQMGYAPVTKYLLYIDDQKMLQIT